MNNENQNFQESFSVETSKEGDVLKVSRTDFNNQYNVEFVNQFGFKLLDVSKETTVIIRGTEIFSGGMQVLKSWEAKGAIDYNEGMIVFNDGKFPKKLWSGDIITIVQLPTK